MNKFFEIETRKVISSYGGVGSIVEMPHSAIIIEDFDKWPFFKTELHKNPEEHILDNRLLKRLQYEKGFPKLKAFFRIPTNIENYYKTGHQKNNEFIKAKYFPEWFYCNKCNRFHEISEWWSRWKETLQKYHENNEKIRNFFKSPSCYYCYNIAKQNKKKKFYYSLEQVRFIMTAPTGEIADIPWKRWPAAEKPTNYEDNNDEHIHLDFESLCCDSQDLRYIKSHKYYDLSGIRIECDNCKKKNTLSGLFSLRLPLSTNNEDKVFKKPVIRTSNSVYYPIIVSSIFIPAAEEINYEDNERINKWLKQGKDTDFIFDALFGKYPKEMINKFKEAKNEQNFESENEYRLREFKFITDINNNEFIDEKKYLVFARQRIDQLKNFNFDNLTIFKRLKITTVQIAYTRQEPLDKDIFLNEDLSNCKIKPRYTSSSGKLAEYLPAIDSYGEGIFINIDNKKCEDWLNKISQNAKFYKRISIIFNNFKNNDSPFINRQRFINEKSLAKFMLIHTLSHILIKEFEFVVGYPATSMQERLFVNDSEMAGVLIYTIAGSEGSFGGLISQGTEKVLRKILESALFRATDCASDPVCYNSEEQGIAGLNLAACYSCCLLPETSCEEFNVFLDRRLLIDKDFGFFKDNIKR